jgi:hypothetical protein
MVTGSSSALHRSWVARNYEVSPCRRSPMAMSRRRRATFEALKAEVLRLGFLRLGVWQLSFSPSPAVLQRRWRSGSAANGGGLHMDMEGPHCKRNSGCFVHFLETPFHLDLSSS